MTIAEALTGSARFGIRPGLERVRKALRALGDPQDRLCVLHVAGTNGKGATCALLDSALRQMGFRVGRYTSPHLVSLTERFSLAGEPVPARVLEAAWAEVERGVPGEVLRALTYFELLTVTCFVLYAREGVDWLVLETGLGGRLDATNVVRTPAACVITRIGLDHCAWLGGTIPEIAAEKAGIVKPGVPVVCGTMPDEAREVIAAAARRAGAFCVQAPAVAPMEEQAILCGRRPTRSPYLQGTFNRENAQTAYATLSVLHARGYLPDPAAFFGTAWESAVWPGRFQRVGDRLVDGAHNPPAMRALAEAVADARAADGGRFPARAALCGFCADKDVAATLRILGTFVDRVWTVRIPNPRSLAAEATAALARKAGLEATSCATLDEALAAMPAGIVCGSLFLAGAALQALGAYPHPVGVPLANEAHVVPPAAVGTDSACL